MERLASTRRRESKPMQAREFLVGDAMALYEVFISAVHTLATRHYTPDQLDARAPRSVDREKWIPRSRGIRPFVAESRTRIVGYADLRADGCLKRARNGSKSAAHGHADDRCGPRPEGPPKERALCQPSLSPWCARRAHRPRHPRPARPQSAPGHRARRPLRGHHQTLQRTGSPQQ